MASALLCALLIVVGPCPARTGLKPSGEIALWAVGAGAAAAEATRSAASAAEGPGIATVLKRMRKIKIAHLWSDLLLLQST